MNIAGYFADVAASAEQLTRDIKGIMSGHAASKAAGLDHYAAACLLGHASAAAEARDRERCAAAAEKYGVAFFLDHAETRQ
jgi:hypothetical protein